MPRFDPERIARIAARVLEAAGAPTEIAEGVAGALIRSDLAGHHSHGVRMLPDYVGQIGEGIIDPAQRPMVKLATGARVLVDGQCGFGQAAAQLLVEEVAGKAESTGVAIGAAIRCNHVGRVGEWAEYGASLGCITFIAIGDASATTAPFGGAEGRWGTNPLGFAAPTGEGPPMLLDFATSAVAAGKVAEVRAAKRPVPAGWILDREGRPSTEAADLFRGGVLLPFGGHKGSALGLMVQLMTANLTGEYTTEPSRSEMLMIGIDPAVFGPREKFEEATRATLDRVRNTRPAEGFRAVLAPGDPEQRAKTSQRRRGVLIDWTGWQAVLDAADEVEIEPAEIKELVGG